MKKSNLKIISLVLVFLMVFCTIPSTAVGVQDNYYDVSKSFGEMENLIPEPEIVPNPDYVQGENTGEIVEIIDRREENVKHFRLEDGSARAIVYSYAVHRKDENGVWQDIDNRLFKSQNGYYSTSENRVSFAGNANDKSLFTLKENGYVISMGLVTSEESIKSNEVLLNNSLPRDEQLLSASKKITADEKLEKLSKIDNKTNILYKRVANGVDLSYTLQSNEIKEYIVVNSPQNEYVYNFTLQLDGLVAQLMENGSVVLYDELTKEDEYYIPAPYMFDAKGERSTDVHYKLNDLDNGQYTLTVIADTDWVNNNSRVFPVMIDPTLQQKILYDTYINSSEPETNYGTSSELWVSSSRISYIRANLTSIPSGSEIYFAAFNAAYYYYSHITDGTLNVGVYQVEKSWTETGLTWNSVSQYSNQGISTIRLSYRTLRGDAGAYQSSPKWQSFVITDAVNSWFNGSPNYGVALKRESGTNGSIIINAIANRYYELLGLQISTNGATYYNSAIDSCKNNVSSCGTTGTGCGHNGSSCNINALCSHLNPHTILFNSTNSVSSHFNNNTVPAGSNTVTKAYWSGHRIKTYTNAEEYNRCYSSGTSIYMLELSTASNRAQHSKGILMHELNHQYGAPDHYHEIINAGTVNERCRGGELCSVCGSNPRPNTCIMNRSRIDITAPTVICPGCKADMYLHLAGHH